MTCKKKYIITEQNNEVATLTMNRPEKCNALNKEMVSELVSSVLYYSSLESTKFIVLKSVGNNFCAGIDFNWINSCLETGSKEFAVKISELFKTIYLCSTPIISIAQGNVYGGGAGILACSDIAIGSNNIKICFSEIKLGLIPALMSPYIVEYIGINQARKYFTTGEIIDAKKASNIGLIHDIVSNDELNSSNNFICNTLSNYNTKSLRLLKKLFGEYMESDHQLIVRTVELLYEEASLKETREKISSRLVSIIDS